MSEDPDHWDLLASELGAESPELPITINVSNITLVGMFLNQCPAPSDGDDPLWRFLLETLQSCRGQILSTALSDYGYIIEDLAQAAPDNVKIVIKGKESPKSDQIRAVVSVRPGQSLTEEIVVHPSTTIFAFRQRMAELNIPLGEVRSLIVSIRDFDTAIENHPRQDKGLMGFLNVRGSSLEKLQAALAHRVPVVRGDKPFGGRGTRRVRRSL